MKQDLKTYGTTGTPPERRLRPIAGRMQSGRRIMHIAQAITPRLSKAAATHAASKAADVPE